MTDKPLKRHQGLQPWSRDHHDGLLLVWKIRQGLKQGVQPERIGRYVHWFWEHHIASHFNTEELYLLPILPGDDPLVKKTIEDHVKLKSLFTRDEYRVEDLSELADLLEAHIRFEERQLFEAIQQQATEDQLALLEQHHAGESSCAIWEDEFWRQGD